MSFLVYGALITFTATVVVTESFLFAPVRAGATRVGRYLGVLVSCFLCMGVWVGWGVAYLTDPQGRWWLVGLAYQGLAYLLWISKSVLEDVRIRLQR